MEVKQCGKCTLTKSVGEFYKRKSGERAGQLYEQCKSCYRERGRDYYYQTKEHQLSLVKLRVQRYINERLEFLAKAKNKHCTDCKKFYPPWVMDFDHKENSNKSGDISYMFLRRMWSVDRVKEEINKCDVVCSNCHRQRTYTRGKRNYDTIFSDAKLGEYNFFWKQKSKVR